jgi:hypothetical protein
MYPRNAASPERISIGPVIQISDGVVQTAGVTVRILPFGGTEADGGGTVAYSTDGVVVYTPTQAETNYTSFVLIAKKTGCIPADKTVVTSASATAGHAGTDQSKIANATSTVDLSGTTIKTATDIETDIQDIQSRLPAALVGGRIDSYLGATANNVITHNTLASNAIGNSQLATSAINAIQSGLATSTQATAIETDTQNIQSRLPTALVDGRMASVAQVVSDKEGYKLASDGLALVTSWTVGITGNITGNVTGSVGSISGVTFPANFGNLDITVGGAIDQVVSVGVVDELGASALSANALQDQIATAVAATQALSRLDSMIESDGAGQFRFDTIALEMAPAGGGGGGTDWTANERTAIRAILGVPTSGTTPTDPSSGILDTIRDSVGAIGINVYPVSASTPERVAGTTLTFYRDESRSVSVATDFTLTNLTLQFTVEDQDGNDVYTLNNASINRSGQTFTVPVTTAVTGGNGQYRWSMRDITGGGNSVISRGVLAVEEAASNG